MIAATWRPCSSRSGKPGSTAAREAGAARRESPWTAPRRRRADDRGSAGLRPVPLAHRPGDPGPAGRPRTGLPFAAVAEIAEPAKLGPNLIANPSFEDPLQADGFPAAATTCGLLRSRKEKPAGALQVTDEAAHSGRYSLKWDLSKVADAEVACTTHHAG